MGLTYRWMRKKDLDNVENREDFEALLKNNRTVANVVEFENSIMGYIVYKIFKDKIEIIKLYFSNNEVFDFIVGKLKNKSKLVEMAIPDRDLEMHLFLKSKNFFATKIEKTTQDDFYIFELKA